MIFHDIQQNKDEWFDLRAGKINGSKLAVIMANYGKAFGEPAKKYAADIALEQITGKPCRSNSLSSPHLERGHEEEPVAREIYQDQLFCDVTNGGIWIDGDSACSPDGMVGDDGMVEIKSHLSSIHFDIVRKQSYESVYKWQLIGNLKLCQRNWIDYISYCSDYPEEKQIYVYRLHKENLKDEFNKIDIRVAEFRELIKSCKNTILQSNYFNKN